MSGRTKLGLGVIEAALLVGLLGDALLRATPWGLNVFLWVGVFAAGAHALAQQKGAPASGAGRWLWPVVLTSAAFFAWRDSMALKALDALAILAAFALLNLGARGTSVKLAGVTNYMAASVAAAANAAFGVFPLVFSDVKWKEIPRTGWSRHALAAARGLLIAVPLLLVFGALFVAADAVYAGLIEDTFGFDADVAFSHVFIFAFFAWAAGGYLRGMFLAKRPITTSLGDSFYTALNLDPTQGATKPGDAAKHDTTNRETTSGAGRAYRTPTGESSERAMPKGGYRFSSGDEEGTTSAREEFGRGAATVEENEENEEKRRATEAAAATEPSSQRQQKVSLGIVEIGVVIGSLDLLFFSFVAVQLSYFFGDARHVITSAGLTFSDYARRGFFELVWVALLALPLLLAAHWLLRKQNPAHERAFRWLAGAMVAMLFVIMASAVWRMHLYQSAYGQTELRFYTTAFMVWLGAVFVWFALTVLRGQRERFACGAFVAWLVVLGALHCINPGDLIVRANVAHAREADRFERFDSQYAVSLGADAFPALVEAFDEMRPRDRGIVAAALVGWRAEEEQADWRSWNFARTRALSLVRENEGVLSDWEARRKAELRQQRETVEKAKVAATPHTRVEGAAAPIPGTTFSIYVERHTSGDSTVGFRRTAMLVAGDMVVSGLQLTGNDDGIRTRVELSKVSDSRLLLRDGHGVYVADLKRRSLTTADEAATQDAARANPLGAFEVGASGSWQFSPATRAQVPPGGTKKRSE